MQESPRTGVRWSIISLNGLSYKDAGEYRCQARNMAGISEALIRLKVVGMTRLSRLPKKKSQKTHKSSPKYRKPNRNPFTVPASSLRENHILQNFTPPSVNNSQISPGPVSRLFPVDKYKVNYLDTKKRNQISANRTPTSSNTSIAPLPGTLRIYNEDQNQWHAQVQLKNGHERKILFVVFCFVK